MVFFANIFNLRKKSQKKNEKKETSRGKGPGGGDTHAKKKRKRLETTAGEIVKIHTQRSSSIVLVFSPPPHQKSSRQRRRRGDEKMASKTKNDTTRVLICATPCLTAAAAAWPFSRVRSCPAGTGVRGRPPRCYGGYRCRRRRRRRGTRGGGMPRRRTTTTTSCGDALTTRRSGQREAGRHPFGGGGVGGGRRRGCRARPASRNAGTAGRAAGWSGGDGRVAAAVVGCDGERSCLNWDVAVVAVCWRAAGWGGGHCCYCYDGAIVGAIVGDYCCLLDSSGGYWPADGFSAARPEPLAERMSKSSRVVGVAGCSRRGVRPGLSASWRYGGDSAPLPIREQTHVNPQIKHWYFSKGRSFKWKIFKIGEEKIRFACQFFWTDNVRGSLCNYWHPLPEPRRKIHSSNCESIILRSSLLGLNPSLDRLNQDQKKGKNRTSEGNLNVALASWLTSLPSQNCHSLACFLSIMRTGENSRWIDD